MKFFDLASCLSSRMSVTVWMLTKPDDLKKYTNDIVSGKTDVMYPPERRLTGNVSSLLDMCPWIDEAEVRTVAVIDNELLIGLVDPESKEGE